MAPQTSSVRGHAFSPAGRASFFTRPLVRAAPTFAAEQSLLAQTFPFSLHGEHLGHTTASLSMGTPDWKALLRLPFLLAFQAQVA